MTSDRLFVYGTLKPGFSRWPILEPLLEPGAAVVDDQVEGRLWDTPWGWPALTAGSDVVRGVLVQLRTGGVDDALVLLDEVECVEDGLFERVETVTRSGLRCWVYRWPHDTTEFTVVDEVW